MRRNGGRREEWPYGAVTHAFHSLSSSLSVLRLYRSWLIAFGPHHSVPSGHSVPTWGGREWRMSERPIHGEDGGTGGKRATWARPSLSSLVTYDPAFMYISSNTSLVSAGGLASRGERYVKGEGTEPEHSVSQGRRTIRLWILELGTRDHYCRYGPFHPPDPTPLPFPSAPYRSRTVLRKRT